MARKKKIIPEELQSIIDEVKQKEHEEDVQEARELVQQYRTERTNSLDYWDVKKEDKVEYFDPNLSYELTGYRPISKT
jgi:glutamyl-tRNA reductase